MTALGTSQDIDTRLADETPPGPGEMAFGVLAMGAWLAFFTIGYLIPTGSLRESLLDTTDGWARIGSPPVVTSLTGTLWGPQSVNTHLSPWTYTWYLVLVGIAYTISNISFLCLSAAFLGCMGRRWSTPFKAMPSPSEWALREVRRAYITAILRGFLVYLLVIAGYMVVLPEQSLVQLSPNQYARLAGAVSALAFVVGWEPESVAKLITTVFANSKRSDNEQNKAAPELGQRLDDVIAKLEKIAQNNTANNNNSFPRSIQAATEPPSDPPANPTAQT